MLNGPASETQITHLQRVWLYVVCAIVCFLLVAPSLVVIPMSFAASKFLEFPPRELSLRWYEAYFGAIEWREATAISFQAALFIARGDSATLTRRMFAFLRDQIDLTIAAISTLLISVSITLLVIAHLFGEQKQARR